MISPAGVQPQIGLPMSLANFTWARLVSRSQYRTANEPVRTTMAAPIAIRFDSDFVGITSVSAPIARTDNHLDRPPDNSGNNEYSHHLSMRFRNSFTRRRPNEKEISHGRVSCQIR